MYTILIAEDDEEIAMLEKDYLEVAGYQVKLADNGITAQQILKNGDIALLLLDIMLPGKNGFDICREMRGKTDIPIIMVTAKTESVDKIRGLGLGADDYIVKPFDPAELVARVQAHIKQYERLKGDNAYGNGSSMGSDTDMDGERLLSAEDYSIQVGNLKIMTKSWKVYKGDEELRLPNREFELLKYLAMNPNIVFSKEHLLEKIWGYDYIGDSATVMVHINRIREKIEKDPKDPKIIETVWGAGYRLNLNRPDD
jgi:DNA-binding response OmpR family regulator